MPACASISEVVPSRFDIRSIEEAADDDSDATSPASRRSSRPTSREVAETLRRMMPPGVEPLKLFRTVAHNPAILERFRTTGAYILNFGRVEPLDREVADPPHHAPAADASTSGACTRWPSGGRSAFGRAAARHRARRPPTTRLVATRQRLLVRLADELHDTAPCPDALWAQLAADWDRAQLIELVATAGFYHFVSFTANALRAPRCEELAGDSR